MNYKINKYTQWNWSSIELWIPINYIKNKSQNLLKYRFQCKSFYKITDMKINESEQWNH